MADAPADPAPPHDARPGAVAASARPGGGGHHGAGMAALTLGALGVVFGDIGTSPLYALQTVFHADHGAVPTTPTAVYGVLSLVFWSVTIIVSIKYVTFIMRADNDGEGGIMALIALIQRAGPARAGSTQIALVALGHLRRGAVLRRRHDHAGDLGALGGRGPRGRRRRRSSRSSCRSRWRSSTGLFAIQRFGTGAVGRLFGPVMALWFAVLAIAGRRAGRRAPRRPARAVAELRGRVLRRPRRHGVPRARLGRARRHRRRGALRRHGPLRAPADPARVVLPRLPGADAQLPRPGRADPRGPEGDREPVLPPASRLEPDPDGRPRHARRR